MDGVAHIGPRFSPYFPPPLDRMHETNARMLMRSERRGEIAALWRVGEPYEDAVAHVVRVRDRQPGAVGGGATAPAVVPSQRGVDVRDGRAGAWRPHPAVVLAVAAGGLGAALGLGPLAATLLTLVAALGIQLAVAATRGRELARTAARRPSLHQIGCAIADGLQAAGLSPVGADGVRVSIGADGEYRCLLDRVSEEVSARFATALDEVVSPMAAPRCVLPRWVVDPPAAGTGGLVTGLAAATGRLRPTGQVWHPVPTVLGTRADRA